MILMVHEDDNDADDGDDMLLILMMRQVILPWRWCILLSFIVSADTEFS